MKSLFLVSLSLEPHLFFLISLLFISLSNFHDLFSLLLGLLDLLPGLLLLQLEESDPVGEESSVFGGLFLVLTHSY